MFPEMDDKKAALDKIRQALMQGHLDKLKPGSGASVSMTIAKPAHDEPGGDEPDADDKGPADAPDDGDAKPDMADVVKALGKDDKGEPPPASDLADPQLMAEVAKALSRYMPSKG